MRTGETERLNDLDVRWRVAGAPPDGHPLELPIDAEIIAFAWQYGSFRSGVPLPQVSVPIPLRASHVDPAPAGDARPGHR
jgi:hypothetical protein